MESQVNRRREPRVPVSHEGIVATSNSLYPCRLADLSGSGARLVFERPVFIRGDFELNVEGVLNEQCVEVWRSDVQMGVAFRRGGASYSPAQNLTS